MHNYSWCLQVQNFAFTEIHCTLYQTLVHVPAKNCHPKVIRTKLNVDFSCFRFSIPVVIVSVPVGRSSLKSSVLLQDCIGMSVKRKWALTSWQPIGTLLLLQFVFDFNAWRGSINIFIEETWPEALISHRDTRWSMFEVKCKLQ